MSWTLQRGVADKTMCDVVGRNRALLVEAATILRDKHEAGIGTVVDSLRPGIAQAPAYMISQTLVEIHQQAVQRNYEMRQGLLRPTKLGDTALETQVRPRRFAPVAVSREPTAPAARSARPRIALGADLRRGLQTALVAGAAILGAILLADFAVQRYQAMQLRDTYVSVASAKGQPFALARAARARALLLPDAEMVAEFVGALELHAQTPDSFERARTEAGALVSLPGPWQDDVDALFAGSDPLSLS